MAVTIYAKINTTTLRGVGFILQLLKQGAVLPYTQAVVLVFFSVVILMICVKMSRHAV